ncbi:TolC family protein [Pirellulaceae bacterium SH501]
MKRNYLTWTGGLSGLLILGGCASQSASSFPNPIFPRSAAHPRNAQETVREPEARVAIASDSAAESNAMAPAVNTVAFRWPEENVIAASSMEHSLVTVAPAALPAAAPMELEPSSTEQTSSPSAESNTLPINLPTALAMIGGQHPVVGLARWRVQEAYARLDRAKVMWLPSIQSGFNYRRRDGNYQGVDGSIVDVNLNSMNYGLGAGAVAAGSPTQPGVVAQFHLADALFLPKAAEKTAWARGHAANAVLNQQLLNGGLAYIELLEAYQDAEVISQSVARIAELAKITQDYADAGEGLKSDADRTATELSLLESRQFSAQERQLVASTRLARELSVPMSSKLLPQDPVIVPLELAPANTEEAALIATGLTVRPELKESQALVAAACEAFKREKYSPFVPSVLLGFSTTSFGGGLGSNAENFGGRYDVDAMMVWQTRNLGFGEAGARRERNAQVQQANFEKLRWMDLVAQQVAEANVQVQMRRRQIGVAERAIASAGDSYRRNMERIRDGQGLPIEALQSIQAMENAQRAYLQAVASFNRAQLQLQWALGWPIDSSLASE